MINKEYIILGKDFHLRWQFEKLNLSIAPLRKKNFPLLYFCPSLCQKKWLKATEKRCINKMNTVCRLYWIWSGRVNIFTSSFKTGRGIVIHRRLSYCVIDTNDADVIEEQMGVETLVAIYQPRTFQEIGSERVVILYFPPSVQICPYFAHKEEKVFILVFLTYLCRYMEEHIQRTGVAIETQGFTFITSGKKRESLTVRCTETLIFNITLHVLLLWLLLFNQ